MVPKLLHVVWIGDENKRPDNCIETWKSRNPEWKLKVWGNAELRGRKWLNHRHISTMAAKQDLGGVVDMMRYEILFSEGGFAVDADSVCLRALPDWLLEPTMFGCWENEICRPGLLAGGCIASEAQDTLLERVIADIRRLDTVADRRGWQTVGPQRFTQSWRESGYTHLTIYPSHYFIPQHYTGVTYKGTGPVFATQLWAGTRGLYETLHRCSIEIAGATANIGSDLSSADQAITG